MARSNTATQDRPAETAVEVAALQEGEHNPFLEGLLQKGQEAAEAIKQWYATRDNLRTQARAAVSTGFASDDQASRVAALWPMPKRTAKGEGDDASE